MIAAACVAAAAVMRVVVDPWVQGAQFITILPGIVLASFLAGIRNGLVAVVLSTISVWLLFGPSSHATAGDRIGGIEISLFAAISTVLAVVVGGLHIALREVARGARELQQSRDRLGDVIEGFPDAVLFYEGSGDDLRLAYANSAGATLLGQDREAIIGRPDTDIISPAHVAENREVLSSNRPLRITERLLETSNGTRCVEVRKFPLQANAEDGTALLTIVRDVTEVRELEETLRQRHRIDALGQLTGGIAHDFNNLLAIAIGNIDLLEDESPFDTDAKELLDSARNACLRGAELTRRLLAFARKQTLQPLATDINQLIADYTKLLARLLGADIDLQLKLADGIWPAIVDQAQLEAAITNLATNARDAMPSGGVLTISTRNEILETTYTRNYPDVEPGEYVAIEVSDTGQGMTPEVQKKAIEPFFTTKLEGHGTGLGLSMVFGFAKQSGGHVRIYSEPGEGTTVTLLLPRVTSSGAEQRSEPAAPSEAIPGETVLVVDDNANLRRVAVRQLSSLGYRVLEAEDGPSALDILEKDSSVDLLLTDIIMPGGLNGVELGRKARQIRSKLKLIYMSGFPESAFGDRADLERDVILLRKPFRKVEIANRIREVLDANVAS